MQRTCQASGRRLSSVHGPKTSRAFGSEQARLVARRAHERRGTRTSPRLGRPALVNGTVLPIEHPRDARESSIVEQRCEQRQGLASFLGV